MTDTTKPASHDVLFFASRIAPASLVFVSNVQSSLRDVEAAMAETDWFTATEACAAALKGMFLCRLILSGLEDRCDDSELDLLIALDDGDIAGRLTSLPSSYRADETAARTARESMLEAAADLEQDLPIQLPTIRTTKGYFPAVRIGADFEALRAELGLPPLNWMAWL